MATRDVLVEATLTDSDGNPLEGKTINFYHKLSSETTYSSDGSATTDANGKASITLTLDVPNTYDFKAEFPGDENYESSSAELTNQTIKAKTTLSLTVTPQ